MYVRKLSSFYLKYYRTERAKALYKAKIRFFSELSTYCPIIFIGIEKKRFSNPRLGDSKKCIFRFQVELSLAVGNEIR